MENKKLQNLKYFCLETKTGFLFPLTLPFTTFNQKHFKHSTSRQSKLEALAFRQPLSFLGKQYKNFLIVCTPAHSIQVSSESQRGTGFVKVDFQTKYPCYLSGKRSAIMQKQQNGQIKYYRFKGCGNMFSGFVHQLQNGLRGSHFYHTSKRQMLLTHQINIVLSKRNKIGANRPIAYFQYQSEFTNQMPQDKKVSDDIPNLLKYCCVFQTLGQRRLGTHLISSLDILISKCFKIDYSKLKDIFSKNERYENEQPLQTPIQWQFEQLNQNNTFLQNMIKKRKQEKQPLNLINYFTESSKNQLTQTYFQQTTFIDKIIQSFAIIETYSIEFKSKLSKLLQQKNLLQLILILCTKIGTQVGQVKRIFVQQQINWGFFDDHKIIHCNAHLNNFVILEDKQQYNNCLLAPLDFDLSFNKTQFINIDRDSSKYGQRDDLQFQNLLEGQYKSLQLSMSGEEVMNFKYGINEEVIQNKQQKSQYQMLRYLIRDQIMMNFQSGFYLEEYKHKQLYQKNKDSIRLLIQVCLILSMKFQT